MHSLGLTKDPGGYVCRHQAFPLCFSLTSALPPQPATLAALTRSSLYPVTLQFPSQALFLQPGSWSECGAPFLCFLSHQDWCPYWGCPPPERAVLPTLSSQTMACPSWPKWISSATSPCLRDPDTMHLSSFLSYSGGRMNPSVFRAPPYFISESYRHASANVSPRRSLCAFSSRLGSPWGQRQTQTVQFPPQRGPAHLACGVSCCTQPA